MTRKIEALRTQAAEAILDLFEDETPSPALNRVDKDRLMRYMDGHYSSEDKMLEDLRSILGEQIVDTSAVSEGRILELSFSVPIDEERKRVNQVRERMREIQDLRELGDTESRIRDPESGEEIVSDFSSKRGVRKVTTTSHPSFLCLGS